MLHLSCSFHLKKYFFLFPLEGCQTPGENKEKRFICHQEHSYISKSIGDYCVLFFFCMISRFATAQDGKPFQCHQAKYVLAEEEGKLRVIIVMRQLRFADHTLHTVEYHMVLTSQQAKLGW